MPGGRPKGSEGSGRREARRILKDEFPDYHPLRNMAKLANDKSAPAELRFQADKEVIAYILPKLRSVEITGEDGGPLRAVLSQGDVKL